MSAKAQRFIPKGMKRDYSPSKADPQFAFENHNIRITAREGSTLMSITNEKGNTEATMAPESFNVLTVNSTYSPSDNKTYFIATLQRAPQFSVSIYIYMSNGQRIGASMSAGQSIATFNRPGQSRSTRSEIQAESQRIGMDGIKITNTEDPKDIAIFPGDYVGHGILNSYLVLFFHMDPEYSDGTPLDYIVRLEDKEGQWISKILYVGDLGLSTKHPIESLGIYENIEVQKVYWVDEVHQPRVINIVEDLVANINPTIFDFAPNIPEGVTYTVTQAQEGSGLFSPGTIQYAFTFYRQHGQETGISKVSGLYYIGFKDRGAAPDESVNTAFTITVKCEENIQIYDYVRVYSIHRTSLNATPTVKVLGDIPITSNNFAGKIVDTGRVGYNVDPTMLLYLGSSQIKANTLEQKDGTLFLGGYSILEEPITYALKDEIRDNSTISFEYVERNISSSDGSFYPYKNQLSMSEGDITTLKSREWYRFGVQLQYSSGKWSDVVWIGDRRCSLVPKEGGDGTVQLAKGVVTLSETIRTKLAQNFMAVRGVIVFPDPSNREVICQGVLCPTVYNVRDRASNSPFIQSSWFFRETLTSAWLLPVMDEYESAAGTEMRHNDSLKWGRLDTRFGDGKEVSWFASAGGEIQGLWVGYDTGSPYISSGREQWILDYPNQFFVDQSTVTFHSPDIEFNSDRGSLQGSGFKLRIVGAIPLHGGRQYSIVETENLGENGKPSINNLIGYYRDLMDGRLSTTTLSWRDTLLDSVVSGTEADFLIYPWHRAGSLNNFPTPEGNEVRTAKLKTKTFSNLRVAKWTTYLPCRPAAVWDADGTSTKDDDTGYVVNPDSDNIYNGITDVQIFDSDQVSMLRLPEPANSNLNLGGLNYYGNVDTTFTNFGDPSGSGIAKYSYPIAVWAYDRQDPQSAEPKPLFLNSVGQLEGYEKYWVEKERFRYGSDMIPMSYKSSPHAVFSLNYTRDGRQRILPVATGSVEVKPQVGERGKYPFWAKEPIAAGEWVSYEVRTDLASVAEPILYLAELYRTVSPGTLFGGDSESAKENNKWLIAGDSVELRGNGPLEVSYIYGDTYYQRYDCLKTYPFGGDKINNIVEIVSFMCETRINIDGRYDKNRGQSNNTTMTPLNFNLLNPAYSQLNNFFTYNVINSDLFSVQDFQNSLTWTKTKSFGEEIDAWTQITLASVLDMDGDKGRIEAIRKFNNELYCFQPLGISRILYNSRAQMSTVSEGAGALPVELMNTGKVDGKVYISNGVGSSNKWSIVTAPTGLYFLDDLTNSLYTINTNGVVDMSDRVSFREWVSSVSSTTKWNPKGFGNVVSFYDSSEGDIYFVTNSPDTTVVYSELLGQFTSFMDYDKTPLMFSMNGRFHSLKNNKLWSQNAGAYNSFFGKKKPYSVEVICNTDEPVDKIFNTIEWRATISNGDKDSTSTFDTVRVVTDGAYQDTGDVSINNKVNSPIGGMISTKAVSLRRKFRMWRIPVPRDKSEHGRGRDRMRGPWAKIKLFKAEPADEKMELHDIVVHFFE